MLLKKEKGIIDLGWNCYCFDHQESELMRGINFEDEITFVLILRKVRSFVGSSSLNMVLAWSTRLLRSPLYWTVVALSRVDLIGTFFKFCYLFVCVQKICLTPSLLTTIVPITPLWLTSRFRVSSTSDAIFLKYQI